MVEYLSNDCDIQGSSSSLMFQGIFQGREKEIRITQDNQVSVFDLITIITNQSGYHKIWDRIMKSEYGKEILTYCQDHQFEKGKKKTPVISAKGVVKLLMWLPGETAKIFRSSCAETLVRFLGGDMSLIDEIKAINQLHIENPENPAQIFREDPIVQQNLLHFSQDQLNNSRRLITHFGDKKNLFYILLFEYEDDTYVKFGIIRNIREFHARVAEHNTEFGDICFIQVFQCTDPESVEKEFKQCALFQMNKCKIPYKNKPNSFHTEIIKISASVTCDMIIQTTLRLAGNRILDPPPTYDNCNINTELDLEREKTRQMELEHVTKQKQIDLEDKKLEFEMMKWKATQVTQDIQDQVKQTSVTEVVPVTQIKQPVPVLGIQKYKLKKYPYNISGYKNILFDKRSKKYYYSIIIDKKTYTGAYSRDLEFTKNEFIKFHEIYNVKIIGS